MLLRAFNSDWQLMVHVLSLIATLQPTEAFNDVQLCIITQAKWHRQNPGYIIYYKSRISQDLFHETVWHVTSQQGQDNKFKIFDYTLEETKSIGLSTHYSQISSINIVFACCDIAVWSLQHRWKRLRNEQLEDRERVPLLKCKDHTLSQIYRRSMKDWLNNECQLSKLHIQCIYEYIAQTWTYTQRVQTELKTYNLKSMTDSLV